MSGVGSIGASGFFETRIGMDETSSSQDTITAKGFGQKILDVLYLIGLALQYVFFRMLSLTLSFSKQDIFDGNIICETANYAKFSDLPTFVHLHNAPIRLGKKAVKTCQYYGMPDANNQHLNLEPFNIGHCRGDVIYFIQRWWETNGDIQEVAKDFKGGSPLEGIVYQNTYRDFFMPHYDVDLVERMKTFITNYPLVSLDEERGKWIQNNHQGAVYLLEALDAFLKEGKKLEDGKLPEYISSWVERHQGTPFNGIERNTVYFLSNQYRKTLFNYQIRLMASMAMAGLKIENYYNVESTPKELFQTFESLQSGTYYLKIPTFHANGELERFHAIGLIIDEDQCYILDPNKAIGVTHIDELSKTMGRLFSAYLGLDFSTDPNGAPFPLGKRIENFFNDIPNSIKGPLNHFSLFQVRHSTSG